MIPISDGIQARRFPWVNVTLIVANSRMVRRHFQEYYGIPADAVRVVHSAIDPGRFPEHDRLKRRQEFREQWRIEPSEVVGLFAACLLLVLLCFAFAYGLVALGIWEWAAFLIVAGTCLVLVAIARLISGIL